MTSLKKIGLLDINDSLEFLKLKEEFERFYEKIKKAGGEQMFYSNIKSRPFTSKLHLNEIEKISEKIRQGLNTYGKKDAWVYKELNEKLILITNIKENISNLI